MTFCLTTLLEKVQQLFPPSTHLFCNSSGYRTHCFLNNDGQNTHFAVMCVVEKIDSSFSLFLPHQLLCYIVVCVALVDDFENAITELASSKNSRNSASSVSHITWVERPQLVEQLQVLFNKNIRSFFVTF